MLSSTLVQILTLTQAQEGKDRPNIILGNKNKHMNSPIQQGPQTTSGHIPIFSPWQHHPQTKMFNCKLFKRDIEQCMNQPTEEHTVYKGYTDSKINNRYANIENAMNKAIPKKNTQLYLTL